VTPDLSISRRTYPFYMLALSTIVDKNVLNYNLAIFKMKAINFFTYKQRLSLYRSLYRDILKQAQTCEDVITRGHIGIKTRYLIRQVAFEPRLATIMANYEQVSDILAELRSEKGSNRFHLEAYGVIPEAEIVERLRAQEEGHKSREKIPFERLEQSPRHIGQLVKRANKQMLKAKKKRATGPPESFRLPPAMEK